AGKKVVVINETAAHTYWQGENPLGKHITLSAPSGKETNILEIVGIVQDSKYRTITETPRPMMFLPVMQNYSPDLTLHIRTANEPRAMVAAVRREVQALDANLPLFNVGTMEQQKADSLYAERMVAVLLTAFGILALLLAGMGIYGVMAYAVNH